MTYSVQVENLQLPLVEGLR